MNKTGFWEDGYFAALSALVPAEIEGDRFHILQGTPQRVSRIGRRDHLEFGKTRRQGEALLRIYNPTEKEHGYTSAYTFIEMVNDDMPFLVNSITSAVNRHDLSVHITVHPIIRVKRDAKGKLLSVCKAGDTSGQPESYIRLAVDREEDVDPLAAHFLQLDFDLDASHEVDVNPTPAEAVTANTWMTESERQTALERISIRYSIENLRTFPCVKVLEEKGRLNLHGAWFDISTGELWVLDPDSGDFTLVEGEA